MKERLKRIYGDKLFYRAQQQNDKSTNSQNISRSTILSINIFAFYDSLNASLTLGKLIYTKNMLNFEISFGKLMCPLLKGPIERFV